MDYTEQHYARHPKESTTSTKLRASLPVLPAQEHSHASSRCERQRVSGVETPAENTWTLVRLRFPCSGEGDVNGTSLYNYARKEQIFILCIQSLLLVDYKHGPT